jgi:hypothetical protein
MKKGTSLLDDDAVGAVKKWNSVKPQQNQLGGWAHLEALVS